MKGGGHLVYAVDATRLEFCLYRGDRRDSAEARETQRRLDLNRWDSLFT